MIRLLARLLQKCFPPTDPTTMYISIEELPNPRDWVILDFVVGNQSVVSVDIDLLAPFDQIEALIGQTISNFP